MLHQSLANFTVLLVCTWIVFSVKVQGILLEEVPPCRELLARIPITFTDVLEVKVNLTKLQKCIELWTEWRKERVLIGGFSVPSPKMLTKELDRMLAQQARQIAASRPVRFEQFEQPNLVEDVHQPGIPQVTQHLLADVHQPLEINRKRHPDGQKGQPEAKFPNVVPPVRPWKFVTSPLVPLPNKKLKSPPVAASDKATAKRPLSPEQVKQPNVQNVPTRTQVSFSEVWVELSIIQRNLDKNRPHTSGEDCINLVDTLLTTPNMPISTKGEQVRKHHVILHDCAKVWTKLRDRAKDDNAKQALQHQLELMQMRLRQIDEKFERQIEQDKADARENKKKLNRDCALLVDTLPHNPRNLATMRQMLKYKIELDKCIDKWTQLAKPKNKRVGLDDELEKLKAELVRLKDLIRNLRRRQRQGRQNVRLPSKHSKKVQNRMAKPKWPNLL